MTLTELHSETRALAFDDYLELDERFLASANRALRAVYNSRKITAEKKFYVRADLPKTKASEIRHKGGGEESLPLSGKAFSMRLYGSGRITIQEKGRSYQKDFCCEGDYYKGFLESDATAYLSGPTSFCVCNLVTFDELFSENVNDIPSGDGFSVIDLRKELADFLALESMPTDANGNTLESAIVFDGKIKLPASFSGEVSVIYRKRPTPLSLDTPDVRVDVPAEYEPLLPLGCASYLLLDDAPDKAELYREEYEKMLGAIDHSFKYSLESKYLDTDGWA